MNKIVHISVERIDAPELHKITKKNTSRVTRIHNAHAESRARSAIRHYQHDQCTPCIFISCSPIGWSLTGVYESLI